MVLVYVLVANLAVSLGKGVVGWRADSIGMVADAFHSLMDGSSNVIGLIGISLAARPRDDSHAYGHAKFETFASMGIVILLLLTAFQIGESVYGRVTSDNPAVPEAGLLPFAVMGVTIVINVAVTLYERRQGRKLSSVFLVADSRHTLSDIYVSFSVIASLAAVRLGYPMIDAVVGGFIALVIAYAALGIMREASVVLLDRAVLDPKAIEEICMSAGDEGILGCHKIRTRGSESGYWIDLHLLVEPQLTTKKSHSLASHVERRLKDRYGEQTDVIIHIEPGK
ncbi:MAG: cation diffusion facilitator family transporter [Actinobacteria bacterium]|nr:cation diffusion facilitator family transporter [Actinomycetota bacterium]MCL5883691.1 cation diffusion facilitator family transporter [Actinomycetota bacterium]